ncbi:hypothetical protein DFH07DRAFT_855865 [Mycena maculata]|uniref:Uncharacterized protein n=1 Tax=Mycena maculata TaxID=230809 RepID=A0AAD7HLI9_9AGAR|nr:hypothetical protein DFH07DRAFT_855865 [Mycena maculata]
MPLYKSSIAQTFFLLLNTPLVEPQQSYLLNVPLQDMSRSSTGSSWRSTSSIDFVRSSYIPQVTQSEAEIVIADIHENFPVFTTTRDLNLTHQ